MLAGVLLSGIAASAMSTSDSIALSLGSVLTRDVFQRIWSKANENTTSKVAVGMVWIWVVIGLLIALIRPAFIFRLLLIAYVFVAQLGPAVYGGLFWRRGTRAGAISSMLVGEVVLFVLMFGYGYKGGAAFLGFTSLVWSVLVSTVVYAVVSLVTPRNSESALENFFRKAE